MSEYLVRKSRSFISRREGVKPQWPSSYLALQQVKVVLASWPYEAL